MSNLNKVRPIRTFDDLEILFEQSHEHPVLLFKHSNSCGISSHVLEMMLGINAPLNVVVVQEARAISYAVFCLKKKRHHSPQAFVIRGGRPAYHATHYSIDPDEITEELER
ncbi:MAG TPA: DUF2847 family protein [Pyrinomonadaceae bacterium]|nr:DUF2847 family protein [Pyrinomonadaceae bacterium]